MKNHADQKMSAAYGLRENPKKSLRVSASYCGQSSSLPDKNISCKICGKAFLTRRQLCGHLRHHTIGERQGIPCNQCSKRFGSIRALCGHMKSHSEGIRALDEVTDCSVFLIGNRIRKRARTPRFEVSKRTYFDSNLNVEDGSALEEVAISLIMLSEGLQFCAADASVKAVNGDGADCNVELVESLTTDGFKKLESEVVEMGSCFSDKVKQGKLSSEMELDTSNDPDESKTEEFDLRVKDESYVEEQEKGGVHIDSSDVIWDQAKPEDGICSVSHSKLKYRCINCNRDFNSHQALGGHRSSKHKLRRCSSVLKTGTCQKSIQVEHIPVAEATVGKSECAADDVQKDGLCVVGVANFELLKRCKHKCTLCFKVFRSAQALGGHMRAHQPGGMQETSGVEVGMISQSPLGSRKMVVS